MESSNTTQVKESSGIEEAAPGLISHKPASDVSNPAKASNPNDKVVIPDFSQLQPKPLNNDQLIKEILPKAGLVYSEKALLSEALCKPKLLPLKSATLLKLENMENEL